MKPFRLAAEVPADLQAAYDFYAARSPVAAERFIAAYVETRDRIVAHPLLYRVRPHGWRQATLPRFPRYALFYREYDACWLIGALFATVQDTDRVLAGLLVREVGEQP